MTEARLDLQNARAEAAEAAAMAFRDQLAEANQAGTCSSALHSFALSFPMWFLHCILACLSPLPLPRAARARSYWRSQP